jgi:hypothetical protein
MCKPCKKDYNAAYYDRTKTIHNPSRFARRKQARLDAIAYVTEYLRSHPCVDCGETDIVVLEFDHQRDKESNVSLLIAGGASEARLAAEIEKCHVVCANDHKRRTAQAQGWAKAAAFELPSAASMDGYAPDS